MGYGFCLNIVRHLSSTVAAAVPGGGAGGLLPFITNTQSQPFGAKALRLSGHSVAGSHRGGGPHRGGFAPPSSFGTSHTRSSQHSNMVGGVLQVHVQPPQDLKLLKLIHRMIESILTHGPEFEALLMSKDCVRNDPKFSWLWDARSAAGVYYRWKLWEIVTGYAIDKPYTPTVEIFDGGSGSGAATAVWVPPKKPLKYEWAGSLKDVVEDYDFMSDELEDDSDKEDAAVDDRLLGGIGSAAGGSGGAGGVVSTTNDGKRAAKGYLGVLKRSKLIHLISRISTQTSKVRRGDVGRVMAFAMEHAEGGMGEEVVDILVSNILKPLAFTQAALSEDSPPPPSADQSVPQETSSTKIIGLWLISDILSNSSLGVRAAWRYRQLFDSSLRSRGVFTHLGTIYRDSGWGRMKAEKFRRMIIDGVLEGWEKWCIFPQSTHEAFITAFLNPPLTTTGTSATAGTSDNQINNQTNNQTKPSGATDTPIPAASATTEKASRWKAVDTAPTGFDPEAAIIEKDSDEDIDGEPLVEDDDDDIDGEPMPEDWDDGDVDGDPMSDNREDIQDKQDEEEKPALRTGITGFKISAAKQSGNNTAGASAAPGGAMGSGSGGGNGGVNISMATKRKRPKAEDMFADDYD
jgi:U2-associated protein SR140